MNNKTFFTSLVFIGMVSFQAHGQFLPGYMPTANTGLVQASQNAQNSLHQAATFNTAMGAGMMVACMMGKPPNMLLCMMGMLSLMQGMNNSDAAKQAGSAVAASSYQPTMIPLQGQVPGPVMANLTPTAGAQVSAGMRALTNAGYKVTSAGVEGPQGFLPASAFNDPEQLKKAGFSSGEIAAAGKAIESLRSDLPTQQLLADQNKKEERVASKVNIGDGKPEAGAGGSTAASGKEESEGVGDIWRKNKAAPKDLVAEFCAAPGRSQCPSCSGVGASATGAQIEAARANCPMDPLFMNPLNADRRPASDVAGSHGPSVFTIASQTIEVMCHKSKLRCTP